MADGINIKECALNVLRHMVEAKIIKMPHAKEHGTLRGIELYQEDRDGEIHFHDTEISAFWRDEFGRELKELTPPQMIISEERKNKIALIILEYWLSR